MLGLDTCCLKHNSLMSIYKIIQLGFSISIITQYARHHTSICDNISIYTDMYMYAK